VRFTACVSYLKKVVGIMQFQASATVLMRSSFCAPEDGW